MVAETAAAAREAGVALQCQECGAQLTFDRYRTTVCPYCACPSVIERPATADRPNPTFVLPFTVTRAHAEQAVRRWQSRLRLVRRSLGRATIEELKGVYVPAYLYSAVVSSRYSAQIGENYTVVETYTTRVNGKTVTRTRTRTRTEWRPLEGEHAAYATDLVVTASRGLPNDELERVEPFDLRALRRYGAPLVSGWLVEEPSLDLRACTALARQEAEQQEADRLRAFMPGDSFRDLRFAMSVRDEAIEPALVPVWVLAVRPRPQAPPMRVVVNGQTAALWGPERLSPIKIALWLLAATALVALVAWGLGR
ncbi:MAG TPA: hypothetical protein VKZ63_20935 [Kofleriaceae bacterium]|nr:hypothetical protein [Kofleriaceae bacterium]